ncbi:MAG TPA: phosphohistidine phosphatase SixA [Terriglobia bacterium]|nr:phosphohistidine phosphatase SixA [Terriglobia bacterium]
MTAEKIAKPKSTGNQGHHLYLMRHGDAAAAEGPGFESDAKRPLTAEGKIKMKEICRGLKRMGVEFDWVVTSPLVRAAETGVVVAGAIDDQPPLDRCEALAPDGSPEELTAFLTTHAERKNVILVGHEPDLSRLACTLMGAGNRANVAFKKGGCCLIRFDGSPTKGLGLLVWWLTPRLLRKLGS